MDPICRGKYPKAHTRSLTRSTKGSTKQMGDTVSARGKRGKQNAVEKLHDSPPPRPSAACSCWRDCGEAFSVPSRLRPAYCQEGFVSFTRRRFHFARASTVSLHSRLGGFVLFACRRFHASFSCPRFRVISRVHGFFVSFASKSNISSHSRDAVDSFVSTDDFIPFAPID